MPRLRIFARHHSGEETEVAAPLTCAAVPASAEYLLVIKSADIPWDAGGPAAIFDYGHRQRLDFLFLVPHRPPPEVAFRPELPLESFVCHRRVWCALAAESPDLCVSSLFACFSKLVALPEAGRVAAIQTPRDLETARPVGNSAASDNTIAWVIPHRGDLDYLEACLRHVALARAEAGGGRVLVGIDETPSARHAAALTLAQAEGFVAAPSGSGPYPLRNALIELSDASFICFQDADDFPLLNRAQVLRAELAPGSLGMVGSHEIRIDLANERILPIRYPLQATSALQRGAYQTLLHPTSMVRRDEFLRAGGFSTHVPMAMDTQFFLRSAFFFESRNVDHFLYVRRIHAQSLTQTRETGMKSLPRLRASRRWRDEYFKVKAGLVPLAESELAPRSNPTPYHVQPWAAAPGETARIN